MIVGRKSYSNWERARGVTVALACELARPGGTVRAARAGAGAASGCGPAAGRRPGRGPGGAEHWQAQWESCCFAAGHRTDSDYRPGPAAAAFKPHGQVLSENLNLNLPRPRRPPRACSALRVRESQWVT